MIEQLLRRSIIILFSCETRYLRLFIDFRITNNCKRGGRGTTGSFKWHLVSKCALVLQINDISLSWHPELKSYHKHHLLLYYSITWWIYEYNLMNLLNKHLGPVTRTASPYTWSFLFYNLSEVELYFIITKNVLKVEWQHFYCNQIKLHLDNQWNEPDKTCKIF